MEKQIVNWMEINSPNAAATIEFYSKLFGWTTSEMDMGEMGKYTMLHGADGKAFAGIMEMKGPEWEGIPPHWMNYFHTDDINASCETVNGAGGEVCHGPFEIPGTGQIAVCKDNQGAVFSLHQPTA
jgi:uncharacterized protein